jgi:O-acetyl-ADP-ribose deacetylase (regulator of RNase III)
MSESQRSKDGGVRFGRAELSAAVGELVDQPVQAIVAPGNQRAMFAAGATGTLWSAAGEEVERELRAFAPFEIGSAHATGAGRLAERGIEHILHAIIASGLGERPRALEIPRALERALDLAAALRIRSIAIPILGVSAEAPPDERINAAQVVVETLVAHLRIRGQRLERGILVSRFEDDRAPLHSLLVRARERLWTD